VLAGRYVLLKKQRIGIGSENQFKGHFHSHNIINDMFVPLEQIDIIEYRCPFTDGRLVSSKKVCLKIGGVSTEANKLKTVTI